MGRGRCRRRRRRRHILTTRDNLIIPFFEPPECLETRRRGGDGDGDGCLYGFELGRGNSMANSKTKDIVGGAADLIVAFKRVHKRRHLSDERKTAL